MNVLMLHNRYLVPGGEDQSTAAEIALLRENGSQVELVEEDNRRIEHLGKTKTALRTLWSQESFQRVHALLQHGRFDVLHVQNFFPLWSPSVYYAAASCRVPVVQTLRNYRLVCVNSYLSRDGHVCEDCLGRWAPWPGVQHACYRESRPGSAVIASMIGLHKAMGTWNKRVQAYIALTEFAREKYVAGGLPADKIVVKPNFVHPAPKRASGGGGYAFFAGRLSAEKGIATMLEAWTSAANPVPLKIAGDGPLSDGVRSAAATCSSIEYVGRRSPSEILDLMGRAEFLVFPSEWYEGMPRTVIEAFAVGTPVVASNIGATASMVQHGRTGFHFVAGDAAGLRSRLEWCATHLEEIRSLRDNARATFEASYTGPANLDLLLSIYRQAQQRLEPMAAQTNGVVAER